MELGEKFPILLTLREKGLVFDLFEHEPIFTVAEGKEKLSHIPGRGSKNLFLRNKKGTQYYLVTVAEEKRVDLSALAPVIEADRISFGSPEKLKEYLNLEPGSVTPLGILFDINQKVVFFIDKDLVESEKMQLHPMRNDGTIVLAGKRLIEFFAEKGRESKVVEIPIRLESGVESGTEPVTSDQVTGAGSGTVSGNNNKR